MLSLDQIKQLESRVSKAIELMQSLKDENDLLKLELHDRQKRIDELENIVLVFKNDQAKIEEGIINALNHLSAFEDTVYQSEGITASAAASTAVENHVAGEDSDSAHTNTQPNTTDAAQASTAESAPVTQQAADSENQNPNQMEIF